MFFKKAALYIAYGFRKLHTTNDLVKPLPKKRRFRTPSGSQYIEV